jgi:hypothetical protein
MQNMRRIFVPFLIALLLMLTACTPRLDAEGRWSEKDASSIIQKYFLAQNPGLNPDTRFPVEDVTTDEIWQQLHIQVFRITDDIYADESFIINGEILVQMGTAFGGSGVNSMLVSELYQKGTPELLFVYNFGSGIHQSHISAYLPYYDASRTLECEVAYRGDLQLVKSDGGRVDVLIIDPSLPADQQDPTLILGSLSLVKEESQIFLDLEINSSLPDQFSEGIWVFK